MAGQRPGSCAENYKSPARGIAGSGGPAWIEMACGRQEVSRQVRPASAQALAHLWFMQRKKTDSAAF